MKIKPLKEKLVAWAKVEVVPSLREWKNQFDAGMSPADLQRLNELRTQASELRRERMTLMPKMREARHSFNQEGAASEDAQLLALREQSKKMRQKESEVFAEAQKFAEKYEASLKTLSEQAKPKLKQWLSAVLQQAEDFAKQNESNLRPYRQELMGMLPILMHADRGFAKRRVTSYFLLWDGAEIPELSESLDLAKQSPQNNIAMNASFSLNQNTPNPVISNTTNISFSLQQADYVRIVLLDETGSQVAVICEQQYPAGPNVVQFGLGSLANGAYTYRLSCSQGTLTNTMTVLR